MGGYYGAIEWLLNGYSWAIECLLWGSLLSRPSVAIARATESAMEWLFRWLSTGSC